MAQGKIKMPYFKGINQTFPEMGMSVAADAMNMDISGGSLKVCKGTSKYTYVTVSSDLKSLGILHKRSGSGYEDILLAVTDTHVYCWAGNGFYGIKSGLTGTDFTYLNYQLDGEDICIMSNGKDTPFYVDGLYTYDMPDVPKFTDIALHYERMWGFGVEGYPDRIYYSAPFDPTDFSTSGETGFIELPSFDGKSIIAIETLFDDVVVFKQENIYRVIGTYPGTYEISKIHGVVGPIAGKTVINAGDMVMFLASEGICIYNGVKAVPFKPKVMASVYSDINKLYVDQACAVKWGDKVLFAVPFGTSHVNNAVIEYDLSTDAFMIRKGFEVIRFVEYEDELLFIDGSEYLMAYDSGDDFNGANIDAFWETPFTDCGDRAAMKYLDYFYAFGKGDGVKLSVVSEKETKEKTIVLNPSAIDHVKAKLQGKGVRFKLKVENIDGGYFELYSPEVRFEKDV